MGVGQGTADLRPGSVRVFHVEAQVRKVDAGAAGYLDLATVFEVRDQLRGHVILEHLDLPTQKLHYPHIGVLHRNQLHRPAIAAAREAQTPGVRPVVQDKGAAANRLPMEGMPAPDQARRQDADAEIGREQRIGLAEPKVDLIRPVGADLGDDAQQGPVGRCGCRVE